MNDDVTLSLLKLKLNDFPAIIPCTNKAMFVTLYYIVSSFFNVVSFCSSLDLKLKSLRWKWCSSQNSWTWKVCHDIPEIENAKNLFRQHVCLLYFHFCNHKISSTDQCHQVWLWKIFHQENYKHNKQPTNILHIVVKI